MLYVIHIKKYAYSKFLFSKILLTDDRNFRPEKRYKLESESIKRILQIEPFLDFVSEIPEEKKRFPKKRLTMPEDAGYKYQKR